MSIWKLAAIALLFSLSAADVAAQAFSGKFSGSSVEGTVDVDGDGIKGASSQVGGTATFGRWSGTTVSELGEVTGLCGATAVSLPYHTWSTVQRFSHGDLVYYALDDQASNTICFNYVSGEVSFEIHALIVGGTGRFESASGRITLTGTGDQLLTDVSGAGVHSAFSGRFSGEINRSRPGH